MSTPAGWYDDGSGRQRWWDGAQWTENYAPVDGGVETAAYSATPGYVQNGHSSPVTASVPGPKLPPTLGFIGFGLAVLGTILACIPTLVTFIVGLGVLLAAFVVSLVAVVRKNTAKWPSIVGIILSVVGGVVGSIVISVVLFTSWLISAREYIESEAPIPVASEQPSDSSSTVDTAARPSPESIGEGFHSIMRAGGVTEFDDIPDFYPCMGESFYYSQLSDRALKSIAVGVDMGRDDPEADVFEEAINAGIDACGG